MAVISVALLASAIGFVVIQADEPSQESRPPVISRPSSWPKANYSSSR